MKGRKERVEQKKPVGDGRRGEENGDGWMGGSWGEKGASGPSGRGRGSARAVGEPAGVVRGPRYLGTGSEAAAQAQGGVADASRYLTPNLEHSSVATVHTLCLELAGGLR